VILSGVLAPNKRRPRPFPIMGSPRSLLRIALPLARRIERHGAAALMRFRSYVARAKQMLADSAPDVDLHPTMDLDP